MVAAVKWLPMEFTGVRTPDEVLGDLATIAAAPAPFAEAEASVRSPNAPDGRSYGGALSVTREADLVTLRIGDDDVAVFAATAIRGGWLRTLDGADYYELVIDVGDALIGLADGYNR